MLINRIKFSIGEELALDILNATVSFLDIAEGQKHTFLNIGKPVLVVVGPAHRLKVNEDMINSDLL